MMGNRGLLLMIVAGLLGTGCAAQQKFLDHHQTSAVQTAVNRAEFEMNCSEATGTIISREVVQPSIQRPWIGGIQRAEYTIGVTGCGKRQTYIVICPEGGDGCFAAGPGRFHNQW